MKIHFLLLLLVVFARTANAQNLNDSLEQVVKTYVSQYKFNGTVLVARKGQVLLQNGYGLRDVANASPNTSNTIYEIASLAKQFTAAVVLKLQEQGKLSVQDKLSKYDPTYPNGDKITIHQLLSHTAGVYDYVRSKKFMQTDQSKPIALDSLISIFKDMPLDFEPGTKFSYTNSGYTLLGYIIEKITHKPYRESLQNMILKPLQLTHSGYDFEALKSKDKAVGYNMYTAEYNQPAKQVHSSILYTTGALYSTVGDLYKWHRALMTNRLLSANSTAMMYTPVKGPYGYGWITDSLFRRKRVSHDGSVPGFKSNINRIPEDDVCIIALSNSSSDRVGEMVRVLMSVLYHQPYKLPAERRSIVLSQQQMQQYTGVYEFNPNTQLTVSLEHEQLFITGSGAPKMQMYAETLTTFFTKTMGWQLEFDIDGQNGMVTQLFFYQGKQKLSGKKVK